MILGVGGLAVYQNGGNSHFSSHPQSLLIMRDVAERRGLLLSMVWRCRKGWNSATWTALQSTESKECLVISLHGPSEEINKIIIQKDVYLAWITRSLSQPTTNIQLTGDPCFSTFYLTCLVSRKCDPAGQDETQRAWRRLLVNRALWGWAAGVSLGHWRNLPALGRLTSIQRLLTLRGSVSFNCVPFQTLSTITSGKLFYLFLYGTYLVSLLHFTLQSCPTMHPTHFF